MSERHDHAPTGGPLMSLPKWYYTDPKVLEREKDKIFAKCWQYAGHLGQLAEVGSYFTLEFMDESLIFVRDADRKIRGFYNVCQHRAHKLVEGQGCKKILTCPYHAWSYALDGRLLSARGMDRTASVPGCRLRTRARKGRDAERSHHVQSRS